MGMVKIFPENSYLAAGLSLRSKDFIKSLQS
jgi:hypothetical protein